MYSESDVLRALLTSCQQSKCVAACSKCKVLINFCGASEGSDVFRLECIEAVADNMPNKAVAEVACSEYSVPTKNTPLSRAILSSACVMCLSMVGACALCEYGTATEQRHGRLRLWVSSVSYRATVMLASACEHAPCHLLFRHQHSRSAGECWAAAAQAHHSEVRGWLQTSVDVLQAAVACQDKVVPTALGPEVGARKQGLARDVELLPQ